MSGCGPSPAASWDATVKEACERNDTKKLAQLLPGADAVDPALLPAIAQLWNEPKLLMLEDCPHWMWWDQKKELLKDYEADKDITPEILDDMHFPLCFRHFFKPCAEGPNPGADSDVKHGPMFVNDVRRANHGVAGAGVRHGRGA